MSAKNSQVNRRDFLKTASAVGAGLSLTGSAFAARPKMNPARVIGANDRINVGLIGAGGRGSYVADCSSGLK
jgi:hypothetical protein